MGNKTSEQIDEPPPAGWGNRKFDSLYRWLNMVGFFLLQPTRRRMVFTVGGIPAGISKCGFIR